MSLTSAVARHVVAHATAALAKAASVCVTSITTGRPGRNTSKSTRRDRVGCVGRAVTHPALAATVQDVAAERTVYL